MANNSLLELETVRRRIEQLDGERQGLSDLIKKLRQIRDTMTSLQKELDGKKTDVEKWWKDFKKTALSISAKAVESNNQFSASMQGFRQKSENLLQEIADSASQLKVIGEEQAQETSRRIDELSQRLVEEQKAFKEAVQKGILAQFGKMQTQVDASMNEISAHLAEFRNHLAQKDEASKKAVRFLWIGILISFLLGGISSATLLIGIFGK
jgi:DNA repair exonuclease SbcCD ATPase subunit